MRTDRYRRDPGDPTAPTFDSRAFRHRLLKPCPDDADCVIYVIRQGDNLVSIVGFFEVPLEATLGLNPWLEEADYLPVGAELRLPWPDWLPGRPGAPPEPTSTPPTEENGPPASDPTEQPSPVPTSEPTVEPTAEPTPQATPEPTPQATPEPTPEPTPQPTPDPPSLPTPGG
jgi:hypothetical protein